MNALIRIYDFFSTRRIWLWGGMVALTVVLIAIACTIRFHEDIFDFLPQDEEYAESMRVYASLSEASRIVVLFESDCPDSIPPAIDAFAEACPNAITEPDVDAFLARLDFIYQHLPYFLTDSDYVRMDSALANLPQVLALDKQILTTPGTSFLRNSIASDPLRLIPFTYGAAGQYAAAQSNFDASDGYMMTADHRFGFAFYDSPYGSTESANNAHLVDSLQAVCEAIQEQHTAVSVRLLGAPVVAVTNARRIKKDTLIAICLSLLLIIALLLYTFPRKRDIALIVLSISFGWIVGIAALALLTDDVSLIVLGIGSILLGISANYPLHLLVHRRYTNSARQTLQEVVSPLVIGNITTVGAFLALIPLHATALRQLGIFASFNLIGTLFFCVFCLPHLLSTTPSVIREIRLPFLKQQSEGLSVKVLTAIVAVVLIGSVAVTCFSHRPLFDSDISHLNYMTGQQRADFAYFESLSPASDQPAYMVNTAREELNRRVDLWTAYWQKHDAKETASALRSQAVASGFREQTFDPFIRTISSPVRRLDLSDDVLLAQLWPGRFDTAAMNRLITGSLSDSFNYLGMVCSLIVLVFLCLSFRSIVIGLVAFLPMVFSWVVIFALMQLLGLQFNLVNVILATFIFGQGDDYTIFIVEGLLYEYRTGKKMLWQYQQSILLSALIMLLAIGVLVVAVHPAIYSLGIVTLIGMLSVVVMAFVIPRILLHLLVKIACL